MSERARDVTINVPAHEGLGDTDSSATAGVAVEECCNFEPVGGDRSSGPLFG